MAALFGAHGGRVHEILFDMLTELDDFTPTGQLDPQPAKGRAEVEDVRAEAGAFLTEKKTDEAVRVWLAFLDRHSNDAAAAAEFGRMLVEIGRVEESLPWFRRAIALRPGFLAARASLGATLMRLQQFKEAVSRFQDLLALTPDDAEACLNLGLSLRGLKRHEEALSWIQRSFDLRPGHAASAIELGKTLADLERADAAIEAFRDALRLQPDAIDARQKLGALLVARREFDEAAVVLQRVVDLDPDHLLGWLNLGAAFAGGRRYVESEASYRRALALQPGSVVAHCNLALSLYSLWREQEAIEACRNALALEPGSAAASFNLSCILLSLGQFREGWALYHYRFALDTKKWARDEAHAAPWAGQPLTGKSILVLGEQGNGDYLQFVRYLPVLSDLGASVSFLLPSRLKRLLGRLRGPIALLTELSDKSRFDFQYPLLSLPGVIDQMGLPVPTAPYLSAEPDRVERWRERIGKTGFRVGIIWQGHIYPNGDARRSFPLAALLPVASIPGVRLISLQLGKGTEQLKQLPPGMAVEELGADFDAGEDGFLDSAAVMDALDLIITCDTSMAHLAGGLGRPLWIAINSEPEWRWRRHGAETMWYPSARLFRQTVAGDWRDVFLAMADEIRGLPAE